MSCLRLHSRRVRSVLTATTAAAKTAATTTWWIWTKVSTLLHLTTAPSAIPLTVTLQQRSMRVSLPLPRGDSPTVTLEFRPTDQAPFYALAFDAEDIGDELRQNVAAALAGAVSDSSKVDAVAAVSRFLSAL